MNPADAIPGCSVELCCPELVGKPLNEQQAEELAALLKVLADPVCLRLVSLVVASPTG